MRNVITCIFALAVIVCGFILTTFGNIGTVEAARKSVIEIVCIKNDTYPWIRIKGKKLQVKSFYGRKAKTLKGLDEKNEKLYHGKKYKLASDCVVQMWEEDGFTNFSLNEYLEYSKSRKISAGAICLILKNNKVKKIRLLF